MINLLTDDYIKLVTLTLLPGGVTGVQVPREGIPLGRYARPNYYTQLAIGISFRKRISQLPCLFDFSYKKIITYFDPTGSKSPIASKKNNFFPIRWTIVVVFDPVGSKKS